MKTKPAFSPSEHGEQCAVMDWANVHQKIFPMLEWLHAIPNGGDRHPAVAAKLKAEGVKKGVPDLCLPYPTLDMCDGGYCGLYLEMKVKGGTVRPDQKRWIEYLSTAGYRVAVAWSADEAIEILRKYVTGSAA